VQSHVPLKAVHDCVLYSDQYPAFIIIIIIYICITSICTPIGFVLVGQEIIINNNKTLLLLLAVDDDDDDDDDDGGGGGGVGIAR